MGALNYSQRMMRDRLQRSLSQKPSPTQADFDAKPFRLAYFYGDTGARSEMTVLALDEEHARHLGELRNADTLVDMTRLRLESVRQMEWSAESMAIAMECEHADEFDDRQREWARRQEQIA